MEIKQCVYTRSDCEPCNGGKFTRMHRGYLRVRVVWHQFFKLLHQFSFKLLHASGITKSIFLHCQQIIFGGGGVLVLYVQVMFVITESYSVHWPQVSLVVKELLAGIAR